MPVYEQVFRILSLVVMTLGMGVSATVMIVAHKRRKLILSSRHNGVAKLTVRRMFRQSMIHALIHASVLAVSAYAMATVVPNDLHEHRFYVWSWVSRTMISVCLIYVSLSDWRDRKTISKMLYERGISDGIGDSIVPHQ